jgi:hypothetical protein
MNLSNKLRAAYLTAGTAATSLMLSAPAFAGEFADAVSEGVDKTELTAIGLIVLAVCGIILLVRSGRKVAT